MWEFRHHHGGELNFQERQISPQLRKMFRREQSCVPFNVLRD